MAHIKKNENYVTKKFSSTFPAACLTSYIIAYWFYVNL